MATDYLIRREARCAARRALATRRAAHNPRLTSPEGQLMTIEE
ncbi:hypothetical protein [Streptomyces endocoffeicus]|nr:hypothetical protein [Streptomyces endocoffeicus]